MHFPLWFPVGSQTHPRQSHELHGSTLISHAAHRRSQKVASCWGRTVCGQEHILCLPLSPGAHLSHLGA